MDAELGLVPVTHEPVEDESAPDDEPKSARESGDIMLHCEANPTGAVWQFRELLLEVIGECVAAACPSRCATKPRRARTAGAFTEVTLRTATGTRCGPNGRSQRS